LRISKKEELSVGQSFKDLIVWQRSIQLTVSVYKLTAKFPDAERFGLTNQLRRASVSIASNVAEGYGKSSKGEYLLFLGHARGSCAEVETQLIIARELNLGTEQDLATSASLCDEVGKMLVALMKSLRSAQPLKH
jgi:four helix bundle protein